MIAVALTEEDREVAITGVEGEEEDRFATGYERVDERISSALVKWDGVNRACRFVVDILGPTPAAIETTPAKFPGGKSVEELELGRFDATSLNLVAFSPPSALICSLDEDIKETRFRQFSLLRRPELAVSGRKLKTLYYIILLELPLIQPRLISITR